MGLLSFGYGFYGLLAQVFLLRELAVIFLGHELSFNMALASWLLWTGLGSFSRRKPPGEPSREAALHLALLSLAPILTLLLLRAFKGLMPFGSLPGLFSSLAVPALLLAAPCWISGAAFAALSRLSPAPRVYFLECAGALAGGLAATFLLVGRAPGLVCLCLGGAALSGLAWLLLRTAPPAAASCLCLLTALLWRPLDSATRRLEWRGYSLLSQRESRYEHLAIASVGNLRVFFQNGIVSAHFPDSSAREELVHWPLLAHPRPEKVLALGAAVAPALGEILKHPVRRVEIVEPDLMALGMLKASLDPDSRLAFEDPRVRLRQADPRQWARSHPASYDLILQLSPEPLNASLNRLFTYEFFSQARRALLPGGILAFSIPSAENYLAPELAYCNSSVLGALSQAFPHTAALPGGRMILLASDSPISLESGALSATYRKRGLKNSVVIPAGFPFLLMPERREALLMKLSRLSRAPKNEDLRPAAYFHLWRVWLAKFVSPAHWLGLLVLLAGALWALSRLWALRGRLAEPPENLALLSLGFSGMGLEVILLLCFQIASGALYWSLGLLIAAFMAGLALGSGLSLWAKVPDPGPSRRMLLALLLLLAAGELALARALPSLALEPKAALKIFPGLLALDGLIVGMAYPLACRQDPAGAYAADLWGSALGAFLTSAFLIPLAGMGPSLALCAAALLPSAVLLSKS